MQPNDLPVIAEVIAKAVKAATDPLLAKIAMLEARTPSHGKDGANGIDGKAGKDAPPPDLDALAVRVASLIPVPKDGRDGIDGKDGDPGLSGKDGQDGAVGPVGPQGEPGLVGPAGIDGTPGRAGDRGEKGDPGERGERGEVGLIGKDGAVGPEGKAGRDGQPGVPGLQGEKGIDGRDGIDGLGFDDIQVEHDGERSFTFKFIRGDRSKSFGPFTIPVVLERGVFETGKTYVKGDGVSWGGSFFIAQRTTTAKPETSSDWRLAIKRGRDGKGGPGPKGDKGDQGPQGPAGQWGG